MVIDYSFFANPLSEYFKWLIRKVIYQFKYRKGGLRLHYRSQVSNIKFGKYNMIGKYTMLANCEIGDFTYISDFSNVSNAKIGKYCSIGPNVRISPGKHPSSDFVSTHPSTYSNPSNLTRNYVNENMYIYNSKVEIGNDVWIGANTIIIDGVSIGDGAIIGANSVVVHNVEPFSIVGGNPTKLIKMRFHEDEIQLLKSVEWWNWPEDQIQNNIKNWWSINEFKKNIYDIQNLL